MAMHVFRAQSAHDAAHIPTELPHGTTTLDLPLEHVAMVHGDIRGKAALPVRIHSECMTSEVFGSLRCDCKEQLDYSLSEIVRRGSGMVMYLRQEGRGIGLSNKIRAYNLQALGHDTVDANRMLGLADDARRYEVAREMLRHFGVRSVRLMTNNPEKVTAIESLGVEVVGTIAVLIDPNQHSRAYLETKRDRMSHALPQFDDPFEASAFEDSVMQAGE
jgi:GTP cyclohydrolase II